MRVGSEGGSDRRREQQRTRIGIYEEMRLVQVLENNAITWIQVLNELLHRNVTMESPGKGREDGKEDKRGGCEWSVTQAGILMRTCSDRASTA